MSRPWVSGGGLGCCWFGLFFLGGGVWLIFFFNLILKPASILHYVKAYVGVMNSFKCLVTATTTHFLIYRKNREREGEKVFLFLCALLEQFQKRLHNKYILVAHSFS